MYKSDVNEWHPKFTPKGDVDKLCSEGMSKSDVVSPVG